MSPKARHTTGVYAYLEASGVLEDGSAEDIAKVKAEYWRQYKREWKKKRRKNSLTVIFSDAELKRIERCAKKLGVSRTRYIKQSALGEFTLPDAGQVRELLANMYNQVLQLRQSGAVGDVLGKELLQRIERLEAEVLRELSHPKSLGSDY